MFDATIFTQDMLSNPAKLTKAVIDAMERADSTGETLINDPNNGFVLQLAASLSVQAKLSEKIDNSLAFLYPKRARNAEQLYPHLSEFEYHKLYASPATLPFVMAMDANWIRRNGVYYDDNYNRLIIPGTSVISLGGINYSMYHDIEILINRNTGAITAYYDGSSVNPLNPLATNMLLDVQEYTKDGIDWFQIMFNTYQFTRTENTYTIAPEQGFVKTLGFDDQFYAARVYTRVNGNWQELDYSLSKLYYDPSKPTAVLEIFNDSNEVKVRIPQIYFDNNQIGQTVRVDIYTTKGAVNYTLSIADIVERKDNFDTRSSPFAAPLDRMPVVNLIPATIEVQGGSNAMSYSEVRKAILNDQLTDKVAITSNEIYQKGLKNGFELTRVKDDLTERIYFASNVLTDSSGIIIPTFTGSVLIKDDSLRGDPSSIIDHSDGYYTILPTTTFVVSEVTNTCIPMTDGEVANMQAMSKSQLVDELNTGRYVRQPFHITIQTNPKSPQSLIYNLLSPKMTSLRFIAENPNSAPQVSVLGADVAHLDNGTGGYKILLRCARSSNLVDESMDGFLVILSCTNKNGEYVYLPAQFNGTTDGIDIWSVDIETNYHLSTDDFLTVRMLDKQSLPFFTEISLKQSFSIVTSFEKSFDPSIPDYGLLAAHLPETLGGLVTSMARQVMDVSFGDNLSSQIYCGINTSWGNDVYKTADETVYLTTDFPIFQETEDTKVINTRYNQTAQAIEIVELYSAGETPSVTEDLKIAVTSDVSTNINNTTTTINLQSTQGVLVGMKVRGTNIPVGSVVTIVDGDSVTISTRNTKKITAGTELVFTNPYLEMRTTQDQAEAGILLKVASTQDVLVGQKVFGFDIVKGTTVVEIVDATTLKLSQATIRAVQENTLLTIINTTAPGVVKIAAGDIVRDTSGAAIVIKSAQNQYMIPAIFFDGRLFASNDLNDQSVVLTIADRLTSFANQIATIDEGLIEDSDVYYKPARSMGYADFGVGAGKTLTMPLSLSFDVTVYVDSAVYNTQALLSTMENQIISIINTAIQEDTISISHITKLISDQLANNAAAVEMGPISGRDGLRLISLNQTNVTPSIENKLVLEPDGHIKRVPNIKVTYLPKPDTAETLTKTTL